MTRQHTVKRPQPQQGPGCTAGPEQRRQVLNKHSGVAFKGPNPREPESGRPPVCQGEVRTDPSGGQLDAEAVGPATAGPAGEEAGGGGRAARPGGRLQAGADFWAEGPQAPFPGPQEAEAPGWVPHSRSHAHAGPRTPAPAPGSGRPAFITHCPSAAPAPRPRESHLDLPKLNNAISLWHCGVD